jgi:hypothetical protein
MQGRPSPPIDNTRVLSCRVARKDLKRIVAIAKTENRTLSFIAGRLLKQALDQSQGGTETMDKPE